MVGTPGEVLELVDEVVCARVAHERGDGRTELGTPELDAFDEVEQMLHCGGHPVIESLGAVQLWGEQPQEQPQLARKPRHQAVRLRLVVGPEARRYEAHAVAARLDGCGADAELVD